MIREKQSSLYLFQSRILTHVVFWVLYYICFSLLWANDGNYHRSFGLELVLMPLRMGASYLTIYLLMPRFLLRDQILRFIGSYLVVMIVGGILQRALTFFFYDLFFSPGSIDLWDFRQVIRSMVLINSTVLFLSAVKMYDYWRKEYLRNQANEEKMMIVRSEKRNYRVKPSEILYIEGLGNYVTIYLHDRKPMISYITLKELEQTLPNQFVRIHKSFIINKNCIDSYTNENVEIGNRLIPVGKGVEVSF